MYGLRLDAASNATMVQGQNFDSLENIAFPDYASYVLQTDQSWISLVRVGIAPNLGVGEEKSGILRLRLSFYRQLDKAGLPRIHIHDLRHHASTLMRKQGIDLKVIQEILGHSSVDITANMYSSKGSC